MQDLALRVVATLEWLNSSHQLQHTHKPTHTELNKTLVLLLNNSVAGHLLDPRLDTQKLFDMLVVPLTTDTTPLSRLRFQPLTNLRCAVFKLGLMKERTAAQAEAMLLLKLCLALGCRIALSLPSRGGVDAAPQSSVNANVVTFKPKYTQNTSAKSRV